MNTKNKEKSEGYRIGAVSRLTGVSTDNLRVWERRYQTVVPARTDSGDRYYSSEDVARLKLIKKLVDSGDSISSIAALDEDELKKRLSQNQPELIAATGQPCSVVVVGESLATAMLAERESLDQITLTQTFRNMASLEAQSETIEADVLVIEQPTLHADHAIQINDWITRFGVHTAIVVYRFAARDALNRLSAAKCIVLRAPVRPSTIQSQCVRRTATQPAPLADTEELADIMTSAIPERQFDDETLARLADTSTTIKCECPLHLSELISSLSAFEIYSSECESRNSRDAALHNYLNETASRARFMLEMALKKVIAVDNIQL
ncbi:MAG: MerR family transcriptional regulator [Thiotrichales bacterium]|nr:MAG: MerR family transcriptional regulator [Thiotrichales bacterium]